MNNKYPQVKNRGELDLGGKCKIKCYVLDDENATRVFDAEDLKRAFPELMTDVEKRRNSWTINLKVLWEFGSSNYWESIKEIKEQVDQIAFNGIAEWNCNFCKESLDCQNHPNITIGKITRSFIDHSRDCKKSQITIKGWGNG